MRKQQAKQAETIPDPPATEYIVATQVIINGFIPIELVFKNPTTEDFDEWKQTCHTIQKLDDLLRYLENRNCHPFMIHFIMNRTKKMMIDLAKLSTLPQVGQDVLLRVLSVIRLFPRGAMARRIEPYDEKVLEYITRHLNAYIQVRKINPEYRLFHEDQITIGNETFMYSSLADRVMKPEREELEPMVRVHKSQTTRFIEQLNRILITEGWLGDVGLLLLFSVSVGFLLLYQMLDDQ